jgi:hypothetical protein
MVKLGPRAIEGRLHCGTGIELLGDLLSEWSQQFKELGLNLYSPGGSI